MVQPAGAAFAPRVWAETTVVNPASRHVMEKSGLSNVQSFHLEWDDPLPGTEEGEVEYALGHDEWERRKRDDETKI